MDFGAVTTATCLAAALATAIMGLYGRYPIAQAPGMGENFFFVFGMLPAAAAMIAAQVAGRADRRRLDHALADRPGRGLLLRRALPAAFACSASARNCMDAISPSMRNGIAIGIGLFIALIGLAERRAAADRPRHAAGS